LQARGGFGMSECFNDCWICQRNKAKCSFKNQCVVFDGKDCEMKRVCSPKRKKCPLNEKQPELFNGKEKANVQTGLGVEKQ